MSIATTTGPSAKPAGPAPSPGTLRPLQLLITYKDGTQRVWEIPDPREGIIAEYFDRHPERRIEPLPAEA